MSNPLRDLTRPELALLRDVAERLRVDIHYGGMMPKSGADVKWLGETSAADAFRLANSPGIRFHLAVLEQHYQKRAAARADDERSVGR